MSTTSPKNPSARHLNSAKDKIRESQERTYRFMSAIAGDLPGFEEALRSLFAGDGVRFNTLTAHWPVDVSQHAKLLAKAVFTA